VEVAPAYSKVEPPDPAIDCELVAAKVFALPPDSVSVLSWKTPPKLSVAVGLLPAAMLPVKISVPVGELVGATPPLQFVPVDQVVEAVVEV